MMSRNPTFSGSLYFKAMLLPPWPTFYGASCKWLPLYTLRNSHPMTSSINCLAKFYPNTMQPLTLSISILKFLRIANWRNYLAIVYCIIIKITNPNVTLMIRGRLFFFFLLQSFHFFWA